MKNFQEFWPYYLSEHRDPNCRRLHFAGTSLALASLAAGMTVHPGFLGLAPVFGYGLAWVGHFVFEKNRPATFQHPFWSLLGDFRMYGRMLRGHFWVGRNPKG